ncbi:hypothetical protein [Orenia marismortui]|uniref:hypothetical protein n=1 Tax=Orenia marismortui TaxID=46469 RepID=UPI00037E6895|nr:hypothetical protein [Orenia marismortui]
MEVKNDIDSFLENIQDTSHKFYELAKAYDIYPKITKLSSQLWGFVYKSSYGNYYIIINKNLSCELQKKVFIHEVKHIRDDMPSKPYFIGLNMQYSSFEKKADLFALDKINLHQKR